MKRYLKLMPFEYNFLIGAFSLGLLITVLIFLNYFFEANTLKNAFKNCHDKNIETNIDFYTIERISSKKKTWSATDELLKPELHLGQPLPSVNNNQISPSIEEIEKAIKNALVAGDSKSASTLADELPKFTCHARNNYTENFEFYDGLKGDYISRAKSNSSLWFVILIGIGFIPLAWKFLLNRLADVANAIRGKKK